MSATRYPGHLPWAATRKAAAVLRAARLASKKSQRDVAAALGWSMGKLGMAEKAITRMTPGDALMLAGELGVDPKELGLEAAGMSAANDERGGQ